jgi:hypothetical protein
MVDGVRAMPEFESVSEIIQAAKFLQLTIHDLRDIPEFEMARKS